MTDMVLVKFKGIDQIVSGAFDEKDQKLNVEYSYDYLGAVYDPRVIKSEGVITAIDMGGFYFPPRDIVEAQISSLDRDKPIGTLIGELHRRGAYRGLLSEYATEERRFKYFLKGVQTSFDEDFFTEVTFSFNHHSEWVSTDFDIYAIHSNFESGEKSYSVDLSKRPPLWSNEKLRDGSSISLHRVVSITKSRSSSFPIVKQELVFKLTSGKRKMSLRHILDTVHKVRNLLSISMWGSRESTRKVTLWQGQNSYELHANDIGEAETTPPSTAFDTGNLTGKNFANWISNSGELDSYVGGFLSSFDHNRADATRVLLALILSLSDKVTISRPLPYDDGGRMTRLSQYTHTLGMFSNLREKGISDKALGQRLRDGRTYWVHEILENDLTEDATDELDAHLVVLQYMTMVGILKHSEVKVPISNLSEGWKRDLLSRAAGYGRWERITRIAKSAHLWKRKADKKLGDDFADKLRHEGLKPVDWRRVLEGVSRYDTMGS